MNKKCRHLNINEVLRYSPRKVGQNTIARYYERWRREKGIPRRCDNEKCTYHAEPLIWNDALLPLILDHIDGNRRDNRPEKLRYLCPNCDSQLPTRGGRNKGRVAEASDNSFALISRDGRRDCTVFLTGLAA